MRIDQIHPAGWIPARADRIGPRNVRASVLQGSPGLVARWLLLCAVIAGVFLLHVLTAENNHSTHGTIASPAMTSAAKSVAPVSGSPTAPAGEAAEAGLPAVSSPTSPSDDRDGSQPSGCILFLVVTAAAAVVLLVLQRRRTDGLPPAPTGVAADPQRGPPPQAMPRFSLGVIRV